ncbi:hypothetical protein KP509_13G001300 [Ceratopteris richardii]|uniref:Thioredoxin domain-containing protein n=1 Tax=Ceratopteris richardii TaxID=49495 RepID=A0A8T2TEP4_CERRI|nr:hypothetical protein KP509_13G001300 [Ceratopteris richardii]
MQQVIEVEGEIALRQLLTLKGSTILYFQTNADRSVDPLFSQLCTDTPHARFLRVNAEKNPEILKAFSVSEVPCFFFIKDEEIVDKLEGAHPSDLANKVSKVAGPRAPTQAATPSSLGMAGGPTTLEAVQQESKIHNTL